jgi:hypothetical protein
VLIAQDADIALLRERCLQGKRAALNIRDIRIEAIFLEQLLLFCDVERTGIITVSDVGNFYWFRGRCSENPQVATVPTRITPNFSITIDALPI